MPRPSRSNLTRPAYAQSSLSHCSTVRPGIRAHSTGHTSPTGRSQITIPPEWMPRYRGSRCICPARPATASGTPAPRPDLTCPLIQLLRLVAERPPGVAQRHPRPVRDHVGDLGRPVPAVPFIDVLDDLLPAAVLDVQVNVGRTVPAR